MFILIPLILMFVAIAWGVANVYFTGERRTQGQTDAGVSKTPWFVAVGFFVLMIIGIGVVEISPGYVGVVTNLGVVQSRELPPGIHYVMPLVNGVTEFDTRVRAVRLENYSAASQEQQDLFMNLTLNYHVIPDEASVIVSDIGTDFENKIVMPRLLDIPKSVTDDYRTSVVLNSRDEIRARSIELLSQALQPYGLVVDNIALENFSYSPEYNQSIEERAIAEQRVEIRQQELEQARVQAEQATVEAEGRANARIAEATGEAEANRLLNESLTDQLIQWQAIQKLNPNVEVMLVPSGEGFILDLGSIRPPAEEEVTP